ncbi:interferon-induced very large GTPase 1-like [Acipenser ruthenus]|uniref:interferon-induced very large GTPase 1-like n=1 Tax=Acipenser ruthenus TaxID=7906 RepID=UPI002741AA4B|nr:interferon-induced very large GTPase 1-like [Acipenser ruthenus]
MEKAENERGEQHDEADSHKETKNTEGKTARDSEGTDLAKKLQEATLDAIYWSKVLKDELNIVSSKQLQHLGDKEYEALEKHARKEWEKKALQKLLGILERRKELVEKEREQRLESERKRMEQVRQALVELAKLHKGGKDRNDATVKAMEDKMRSALEVPKDSWVPTGQPLKDLIENIHKQLDSLESASLSPPHSMSDEEVLRNASGGLALEGVYETGNLEDLVEKREQLIQVPESFSLRGPEHNFFYEQKEFSSCRSQTLFQKVMEKLGFSFSCSLKTGFWGLTFENTTEKTQSTETEESSKLLSEHSCISNTKYNYIPLASSFIERDKLKLSTAAVNELKRIETIMLNTDGQDSVMLTKRVTAFFERFGSHANQGPLHFGGVFWWKASAEGFKSSELTETKSLMSEALNVYVGAGYSGNSLTCSAGVSTSTSQLKGSFTGKYNETLMSKVQLSISKTGGPAETDNHLQWKSALVSCNKTWCVIDRGTCLIPVWKIIQSAHREEFKDSFRLSNKLMEIYQMTTKWNVELMWGDNVLSAVREAETVIQSVKDWTVPKSEEHLVELLEFKTKLKKQTGSHNIWIQICLSHQVLQDFLLEVVKHDCQGTNLRMLMRFIMEPHLYTVKHFPNRTEIMQWAYQTEKELHKVHSVSEFSELAKIIHDAKIQLQDSTLSLHTFETVHTAKIKATCTITLSLNSLQQTFRENNQEEAEVLILSVITVLGYSPQGKTFNHLLGWEEIEFLEDELEKTYYKYSSLKEQNASRAQAYLLLTALTVSRDGVHVFPADKGRRLQFFKSQMKNNISTTVSSAVDYADQHQDWEKFEEELNSIVNDTSQLGDRPEERLKELEYLKQCQEVSFSETKQTDNQQTTIPHETDGTHSERSEKAAAFMNLLQKLGIEKLYPKQMKKNDVLVIDSLSQNANQPVTEESLCFHYLYKLMVLDYRARNLFCVNRVNESDMQHSNDNVKSSDDFFNDDEDPVEEVSSRETHIHPMDIHMAVFHCANDFLRQYIFTKLSTCQFALPLLVPNPCTGKVEFPLWALRHIKKSWQSKQSSEKYKSSQMVNAPVPIVSFIRLGTSSASKSQILNSVISKQNHSVFFHRHCRGSTPDCLLMDGVVEIAWYCAGGKEDDIFNDCVAFMNLHGDGSKHPDQLRFLQEVSSVNVVLLSEDPLDETAKMISKALFDSPIPLICLFAGKEKIGRGKDLTKVRLPVKNRNKAELTDEIVSNIKHCVASQKKTSSLQDCLEIARQQQFRVDEDSETCKGGNEQALLLLSLLKEQTLSNLKEDVLPLQGNLWHEWCANDKKQYRLQSTDNKTIEMKRSEILENKIGIRHKQLSKALPLNDFMRSFLECLASPTHSGETKSYMLQWLRIYLDELTTDILAQLENRYHSTWTEIRLKQKGKAKDKELEIKLQKDLNKISEKINATTFGLQHIMRETGQVYEAIHTASKNDEELQYVAVLPDIAAEMLISGHPLELMDGDAAHVPLVWIQAVLDRLIGKLENKKIFVLSILGIQSSGKSTLLNTMFGLQFTVSAGRCTRGAFMQLLEVKEEIRQQLKYDFVLIVDTEGLRSPELSNKTTLSHDNELATFIIGIGDATVINIMGENPSEMQDILQICVQAFLRMKSVDIHPSCIFVHQNVAEASAGDKNMEGRRRLQERLDEMARIAAKEEHREISGFDEIIQFDVDSQVFYFKNLLEGDPPMAPPNPTYSHNVQDLKSKLLTIAQWQSNCKFSTLSKFKSRISDVWNALLAENFVFSFRNTLEMMVYSQLEDNYTKWTWQMRKHALKVQNKWHNQIMSNIVQNVKRLDLMKDLDEVYKPLIAEIDKYFKEEKNADLLIKWKANIHNRFQSLKEELIDETQKQCHELIKLKESRSELDKQKSKYEAELLGISKVLASTLKNQKLSEEKVRKEFDTLWVKWVVRVSKEMPPENAVDIQAIVENILLEYFKKETEIINKITEKKKNFHFNSDKHVSQTTLKKFWNNIVKVIDKDYLKISGDQVTQQIQTMISLYITEKERKKLDFNDNFIYEILREIELFISKYEESPKSITFTTDYKVELSVHLCTSAAKRFTKMHAAFKKANNLLTYLDSNREEYFKIFKVFCEGATSVTFFVHVLCTHLKPAIKQAVYDKASIQIVDQMKSNYPAFSGNRSNLENHILKHLAEQENFDSYMEYIERPKDYFQRFIKERVEEYCKNYKNPSEMLNVHLNDLMRNILSTSSIVTTVVAEKHGNASMWLDEFCKGLGAHMNLSKDDLQHIENEDISDLLFLKDTLATSLDEMVNIVEKENKKSHLDVKMFRKPPNEILCQQLSGCWEQCPFCKAICIGTISGHNTDHSVQFHRSEALAGWHFCGTDLFAVDFCTTSVSSNLLFMSASKNQYIPFKTYKDGGHPYDKWSITPDNTEKLYWKWFVCAFRSRLENKFHKKFQGIGTIPEAWNKIKKSSVLDELNASIG